MSKKRPAPKTKSAAKATRRLARPAAMPSDGVAVKPAFAKVVQIIVARGGKTYLHTFTTPPELHAATAEGVLVIRGRFKLNPQGFIVG